MRDFIPFIDRRLYVDWSEEMGHGVFTRERIGKDEFVEIAPVIALESGKGALLDYALLWGDKLVVALGWTMLYNHSDNNSCVFSSNLYDSLLGIMTIRDIEPGEQLTVDYGSDWFSSRGMDKKQI
jgi:hypothetical protein